MDSEKVKKILSLADSYENQLSNYDFNNSEYFELRHTEREIENLISSIIDNEELLLEMIKQHWSIIRFVKKDRAFFIKACTINPECGREARNLELLIQLYKINPDITKYAPPYYQNELAEYLKKNPQGLDEYSTGMSSIIEESPETHISQMSIYDFLKLRMDTGRWYKLAGMITDKQVVFLVARGDLDDHWSMDSKLSQAIFPNRGYNMGNVYKGAIGVFGLGYNISIDIPNKVSSQQFHTLSDIINQVKQFEVDYDMKIEGFDPEAILKEAQAKLSTSYPVESDEVIVGVPIKKVGSEKTQEVVQSANNSTDQSVDDEIENLMDQIHENASQKAEEDRLMSEVYTRAEENAREYSRMYEQAIKENQEFDRKKAEEAREYSKMYEQALKENEEIDRKKAEKVRQYSEMYEQALKENEEFDRRKEEEKHQSLVDNEAQLRQEWKDNKTEESYYNYKNSIKDRLEYENAKKIYEDVSNSNALLSEIESINKAKHFSGETKEKIISEIESPERVR